MVWPFCGELSLKDRALFSFPLDEAPFLGALALVDFAFWLDFNLTGAIAGDHDMKAKFYYLNAQFELRTFAARCHLSRFTELVKQLWTDLKSMYTK